MRVLYKPSGAAGEYAEGGFALNHLTGCAHGCIYCYAPAVLRMKLEDFHRQPVVRKDILKKLELDLADIGRVSEPIFMSFVCDPFPFEFPDMQKYTWLAIKIIHKYGNRVKLLTKNPAAILEHVDLLAPGDEIGTSLVFSKPKACEHWEPGVPASMARRRALEQLREMRPDVMRWISFEPIIDPAQTLLMAEKIACSVDRMWFGPINHAERLPRGYREFIPAVDWPKFAQDLKELMQRIGFDGWKMKSGLLELAELEVQG